MMKMNYLKLAVLSIILSGNLCTLNGGNSFEDSKQAYNYWSKRGIIEVVYAFMNDYIFTVTDINLPKKQIKDCKSEKNGLEKFRKKYIEKIDDKSIESINLDFNDLSNFLMTNNWGGTEKNLLQPLLENQKNSDPLNSEFFSTLKSTGDDKSTNIPGYINKLINFNETVIRIVNSYEIAIKGINHSILTSMVIFPPSVTIEPQDSFLFKVKGYDQFKKEINIGLVEWKTNCGNISNNGYLTVGKNTGKFSVTASSKEITTSASVNVQSKKGGAIMFWLTIIFCICSFFLGCLFVFFWSRRKIFSIIDEDLNILEKPL